MEAQNLSSSAGAADQTEQQDLSEQRIALDEVISESERQARDRLVIRMEDFKYKQRLANLFAVSGLFSDIRNTGRDTAIAQAFVKIELGESMGFTPAESMQGIDIIQGRPAVGASLRAARMKACGYDWRFVRHDEKGCKIVLFKNGEPIKNVDGSQASVEFTEADATKINKGRDGTIKDNWRNFPKNMYFARTITNAQRWYAPEVLNPRILSSEEAVDLDDVIAETEQRTPEPIAAATENKTAGLAEKLRRTRRRSTDDAASEQAPLTTTAPPAAGPTNEAAVVLHEGTPALPDDGDMF